MKPRESGDKPAGNGAKALTKVLIAALCLLGVFALWGFRYPVVGRDAVLEDLPRSLLWWSLGLGAFATTGVAALTRAPGEGAGLFAFKWFLFYTLGVLWSVTFLLAVNGVFDHAAHHFYPARVIDHQIASSKRITQYYLVLADWRQPASRVTVEIDEDLYDKLDESIDPNQMVQVETAPGRLGYERMIKVTPVAPADELKMSSGIGDEDWGKIFSHP